MYISMVNILDQHARTRGDEPFITDERGTWTYSEFQAATIKISKMLQYLGVKKGDRVGLISRNIIEYPLVVFSAWRLAAVIVPINHKLTGREIDYIVEHAGIKIGICERELRSAIKENQRIAGWIETEQIASTAKGAQGDREGLHESGIDECHTNELAELLYTSGTTGKPKGCMHTQETVYLASMLSVAGFQLCGRDKILICMPIWHSSPMNNWLMGGLLAGAQIILMKEYKPEEFIRNLENYEVTVTFVAPIALLMPIDMGVDVRKERLRSLRMILYGGGPLGKEMVKVIERKYGNIGLTQVYGMTETGPNGTALYSWEGKGQEGSVGRSGTPGMEVEIRKRNGSVCKEGEVGEIYVRSPAMMKGYWNDEEATREALDERGWFKTGDIARIEAGGYIYIMDRKKDMIITGGENVYSKEVEDIISGHKDVLDVAVVGMPEESWGETVVAVVVRRQTARITEERLREYVKGKLARYKQPRKYVWVEELPRTPSGKLKKYVIRKMVKETMAENFEKN